MKKLILLLITTTLILTSCNNTKTATYIDGDKVFELEGDTRRIQRGEVIFELLQEKYRAQYPTVVDSLTAKPKGTCNCGKGRRNNIHLRVNQKTCIPLTKKLLDKDEEKFGPNSSYTKAEQLALINHAACADQLRDFELAFVDALNGLVEKTKTVQIPNRDYVAPIVTNLGSGWSIDWSFLDWLLPLLLTLLAILLFIWLLLKVLNKRNQTSATSVTESRIATVPMTSKPCTGNCHDNCTECCDDCTHHRIMVKDLVKSSENGNYSEGSFTNGRGLKITYKIGNPNKS